MKEEEEEKKSENEWNGSHIVDVFFVRVFGIIPVTSSETVVMHLPWLEIKLIDEVLQQRQRNANKVLKK